MRLIALGLCFISAAASAGATLKEGTFSCEGKNYQPIALNVRAHPTKSNKIIINWEGRDRILHQEPTQSGAMRFEGAVSKLTYIQVPHHSVLLDSNMMTTIATECIRTGV